jgi:hypothetical protein
MKNALFLTGAAARISQEVAFVDKLIEHKGLQIDSDETLLAGFSSGALNIAAINACFRKENPLDWNAYFKETVLFNIKSKQVFVKKKFIPLDTYPLRNTVGDFLQKAGMSAVHDLTFPSYVLAFSFLRFSTVWVSNLFNRHQQLNLLDLMMATSAIPIIFPDQSIRTIHNKTIRLMRGRFVDGGAGGSFKRFEYYLKKYVRQEQQFENIYIISPMRDVTQSDYDELYKMIPATDMFNMELKDIRLMRYFLEVISQNGFDTFIKRFHKWIKKHPIANNIYVCIPQMDNNFPILNFDKQREQYDAVCQWIDEHPDKLAIPLNEYVKRFEKEPLRKLKVTIKRRLLHRLRSLGFSI